MISALDYELREELNKRAAQFNTFEDFKKYQDEIGWEDWYDEYLESQDEAIPDGEEITERACGLINEILKEVWNNRTYYLVDDRTHESWEMKADEIFDYFEEDILDYKYEVHTIDDLNDMLKDIQGGIVGYRIDREVAI